MTPCKKPGMLMERTPDMTWAMERKTEVTLIAKPVWAKRVLNCSLFSN